MSTPAEDRNKHWLVRKDTIRKLWVLLFVVLGMTVLAQLFIPLKTKFGPDGWFAFPAIYGFITCVIMVVFAKLLGIFLKREDSYYDD